MKLISRSCGKESSIDIQGSPLTHLVVFKIFSFGQFCFRSVLFIFKRISISPCKFWCFYVVLIEMKIQNFLLWFAQCKQLVTNILKHDSLQSVDVKYLNELLRYLEQNSALFNCLEQSVLYIHVTIMLQASAYEKQRRATIARLVTKFSEKSHVTHQVGVWWRAMIIPFRTP